MKDNHDVDGLLKAFDNKNEQIRAKAAQALGKIGAPVVDTFITVVQTRVRLPVWTGIETALGIIGTPAVEPIIERLLDESGSLGGFAERLSTRIGAPSVEPLIAVLEDGSDESRDRAISTLSMNGSNGGIDKNRKHYWLAPRMPEVCDTILR
jgi:HEAT repeat protein